MTGVVEATSLALAALPIIISATEHFSSATCALKRYRHFSAEVGRLSTLVKVQRTIYHGEIRSLIASCVGLEQAEELLQETDHARWNDKDLEENLATRLGETRGPFLELVTLINAELSEIEAKMASFEEVVRLAKNGDTQSDKDWRHHVKQKSRFAFSQSKLQDSMNTLKELVEYLGTLRSQTERNEQRRPISKPSLQERQVIEQFGLVQIASQNLYDALKSACTKHTQHHANFSLQPVPVLKAHQVRFNMGFRQVVATASQTKRTTWFTVESTVKRTASTCSTGDDSQVASLGQALKRGRMSSSPPPPSHPAKLQKNRVRFQLPSSPTLPSLPAICKISMSSSEMQLSNLCSHSNFCNQLQIFLSRSDSKSECCIGYLEHSAESKHLIYFKGKEIQSGPHADVGMSSLVHILSQYNEGSLGASGIAQIERVYLSRKLATAILQFYSTPWIRNSWNSNDVLFQLQSARNIQQIDRLKEPFVDVSVRDSTITTSDNPPALCYPFAPNDFLFSLGVILIELAFERPLRSMQKPCDVANSRDERHTLFFTAKRMSRLVSSKAGSRYGEIVRKCLTCDFGRGDDLSKPALQEGVYREVVCELGELEKQLQAMNIGP